MLAVTIVLDFAFTFSGVCPAVLLKTEHGSADLIFHLNSVNLPFLYFATRIKCF